jgi:ABC-type branched-subunit amino acid transport system ATPase component
MKTTSGVPPAIEVRGLVKAFWAIRAVDHLDLSVPSGGVFALLGPNGAGNPVTELRLSSRAVAGRAPTACGRRRRGA